MDKFQYLVVKDQRKTGEALKRWLNGAGDKGWGLCYVEPDPRTKMLGGKCYIFKKKIDSEAVLDSTPAGVEINTEATKNL